MTGDLKMKTKIGIYLFLTLLLCVPAFAVTSTGIYAAVNAPSLTPLACNQGRNITATVIDYTIGAQITGVRFGITTPDDIPTVVEAQLVNGTVTNGTWSYQINAVPYASTTKNYYYIKYITIKSSAYDRWVTAAETSKSSISSDESFDIYFSANDVNRRINSSCSCGSSVTYSGCTAANINEGTFTATASPACKYAGSNTIRYACDYCDPLWTPQVSSCSVTNYEIMKGTGNKTYVSPLSASPPNGAACCGLTSGQAGNTIFNHNGASDCTPPPDNGEITECYSSGAWMGYGFDSFGSGKGNVLSSLGSAYVSAASGQSGTGTVQPVVFDVDKNGIVDVVYGDISSTIRMMKYSSSALVSEGSFSLPGYNNNQMSIYGAYQDGTYDNQNVFKCSNGLTYSSGCKAGVAIPNQSSVLFYKGASGVILTLDQGVVLTHNVGQNGVKCFANKCVIGSKDKYAVMIDTDTWAVTYAAFGTNVSGNDTLKGTPVFNSLGFPFYYGGNGSHSYICAVNQISNLSNVCINILGSVSGLSASADGSVYYTNSYYDNATAEYVYQLGYVVSQFGSLSVSDVEVWRGATSYCISNPAQGFCNSGEGIFVQHYNSENQGADIWTRDDSIVYRYGNGTIDPTTATLQKLRTYETYAMAGVGFSGSAEARTPAPYGSAPFGAGELVFYDGAIWKAINSPVLATPQVRYANKVNFDKSSDGGFWFFFLNASGPGSYEIQRYDPSTETFTSMKIGYFASMWPGNTALTYTNAGDFECTKTGTVKCFTSLGNTTSSYSIEVYPGLNVRGPGATVNGRVHLAQDWFEAINPDGVMYSFGTDLYYLNPLKNAVHLNTGGGLGSDVYRVYWENGVGYVYDSGQNIYKFNTSTSTFNLYRSFTGSAPKPTSYYNFNDDSSYVVRGTAYGVNILKSDDNFYTFSGIATSTLPVEAMDRDTESGRTWFAGQGGDIYGTGSVQSTEAFASSVDCYNKDLVKMKTIAVSGNSCKSNLITTASAGADSYILSDKLLAFSNGTTLKDIDDNRAAVTVDLAGTGKRGLLTTSEGGTKYYLPALEGQAVLPSANFSLYKLQPCVEQNGVVTVGAWAKSPTADNIVYRFYPKADKNFASGCNQTDAVCLRNYVKNSPIIQTVVEQNYPDNILIYSGYTGAGNYSILVEACQGGTCSDPLRCEIDVAQLTGATVDYGSSCKMTDGEFDWSGNIDASGHGWTKSYGSSQPITSEGYIYYSGGESRHSHSAVCDLSTMRAHVKIKPTFNSNFIMYYKVGGQAVAGIQFSGKEDGSSGYVRMANPDVDGGWIIVDNYTSNAFYEYALVLDASNNIYYITKIISNVEYNLGESRYAYDVGKVGFSLGTLEISNSGGNTLVDYVRTYGSGTVFLSQNGTGAQTDAEKDCMDLYLGSCDANGALYSEAKNNNSAQSSYSAINQYCICLKDKGESGMIGSGVDLKCSYEQLKRAVGFNSECSKEAMFYCVDQTYPVASGDQKSTKSGQGTTACAVIMGTDVVVSDIFAPIGNSLWQSIVGSGWTFVIFVVVVLIIFAFFGGRR